MNQTVRAALAALALALGCAPALAQSSFPTVGGSYVDGHALMCPNGSTDFQGRPIMVPCGGTSTPVNIAGSFTANLGGFQPTTQGSPISATTAGVPGTLPAGTAGVAQDVGSFPAYCQFGGSATGITAGHYLSGAGAQWAYLVPSGATQITCEGVGGTTQVNLYGGSGLGVDTGGGGGGGGGGGAITSPLGTQTIAASVAVNPATSSVWAASQSGTWTVQPGNTPNTTAWLVTGAGGTFPITASSLPLPTGAATAANQEVTAAGTTATSAQAVQGVTGGIPQPVSTAVNVTPTDCSQTATGSSQTMITASATIHGFTIANIDPTTAGGEPVWISFTGAAVAGAKASYPLAAPTSLSLNGMGSYTSPPGFGANQNVTDIATSGHLISCTRW